MCGLEKDTDVSFGVIETAGSMMHGA